MASAPTCPHCHQVIVADDINVAKDLAYCRRCNLGHELSVLVGLGDEASKVDLHRPPAGTWYVSDPSGMTAGASHRSWGQALGLLAISLFWNGIVSVFVAVALSGTLHHLGWGVPDWFPAPKMNGETMGLGELTFLWLFLTPFILVGTGLLVAFVSTLGGRTEVRVSGGTGKVVVGMGPLAWSRRFDPARIRSVSMAPRKWRNQDGDARSQNEIVLEEDSGRKVRFGSLLKEERQHFLLAALRKKFG
jgi:hypothetical protein